MLTAFSSHLLFTLPLLRTILTVPFTHKKVLCWGGPCRLKGSHTWASWPQVTCSCPRATTNTLCLSSLIFPLLPEPCLFGSLPHPPKPLVFLHPVKLLRHSVPLTAHRGLLHVDEPPFIYPFSCSDQFLGWCRYCVCFIFLFPAQDKEHCRCSRSIL